MKKLLLFWISISFYFGSSAQTWSEDVAPILYAHCTTCHHSGGLAPFSLMTYSDAFNNATNIVNAVNDKVMPPWLPDPNYKHYVREKVLSQFEIDAINNWFSSGKPQGNMALAPAQPTYTNGSALGTADLSVKIPTYTVGTNNDVYRNFPIPTGLGGRYVTAIEVIPGNAQIVHHVLIFQDSTNVPAQLDANDPGPGYTNSLTGSYASQLIGGYTPGSSAYYTPVGTGFRLPANTNIVVQIHYPASSLGMVDSTRINFKLSTSPLREIFDYPLLNHLLTMTNGPINIPANTTKTYNEAYSMGSGNYTFISAYPHMHLVGRTFKTWANTTLPFPNDTIRFVNINDWDFHWQDSYIFPNAIKLPGNSTLRATAFYDNTGNNPDNPNTPPQTVNAGEGTSDEMMMVFFAYMPYQNGDENLIIDRRVIPQGATTFCNGQEVVLKTIEGTGYTYQWYRNGVSLGGATSFSYTATQAGNYHVLITLGPNNSLSDTIAVAVSSSPTAVITPAGSTTICPGSSVTLNASTGNGYSYQWFNNATPVSGATSSSYSANAAGSYSVQIYNGCYTTSGAVNVTADSLPSSTVTPSGATTFCQGESVTLSAPPGLTYNWSTGSNSQSIPINQSGSYTVTVTNGSNCSAVSSATTVTVNSLPGATITPNGATTFCMSGSVSLNAPSGLSYNWSTGASTQAITVNQSGSYTVTVTNGNSCSAASSATTVTVNSLPAATVTPTGSTTFCNGGSVLLTANSNSSYLWSNSSTSQSITASQSGNYSVTVTNANNCSNTASISVTEYTTPDATITPDRPTTICPGESVTLSAPVGMSYTWSNSATTQSIIVSTNGSFTVTVTDNNSCTAVSSPVSVIVSNNATAGISPSGATTFCEGSSVQLTASAGTSYLWSNGATSQTISASTTGTFTVTVTVSGNCTAVSNPLNVVVNQNPSTPAITPTGSTTFCDGGSVDLSAPAGYSYQWSSGATTQTVTVVQTENYLLTITDSNSCSAVSGVVQITVNPLPSVLLSGNADTICTSASPVTLTGESPSGGTFAGTGVTGNVFNPSIAGTGPHTISYLFTDNNGCSNSANETIAVVVCTGINEPDGWSFTISPNPSNGNFSIDCKGLSAFYFQLKLFDVSGKLVYSSLMENAETEIKLEGIYSGYYLLQVKTYNGTIQHKLIVQQ